MNQKEKQEQLTLIWDSIDESTIDYTDGEFESVALKFLEFLIISVLNENEIYIGDYGDESSEGAFIYLDEHNRDKRLELYLTTGHQFMLKFFVCDFEGEEKVYSYALKEEDFKIIPSGLQDIMKEVAKTLIPKKISSKSISE